MMRIDFYSRLDQGFAEDTSAILQTEDNLYALLKDFKAFRRIQKKNLWKLTFMERDNIVFGKTYYDNNIERNYLSAILRGYHYMLSTVNEELTPDLYRTLHDQASEGIHCIDTDEPIPSGYRCFLDGGEAFYLTTSTSSPKGIEELLDRYKNYRYWDPSCNCHFYPLKNALENPQKTIQESRYPVIKLRPTRAETCIANVNFSLSLYNSAPKSNDEEKLRAIVRLCQDLDQFHMFVDGNIRTTGILVMNKLLLQNELSPTVMKDVNMLDCLSTDELVYWVKEGQEFFNQLVK